MTRVLIIGAGQQGLALGQELQQRHVPFVILEKESEIGLPWREHYDSLVLFTPRRYSELPGFPFPGDPGGFPTKDEFADYLAAYARYFELPIILESPVTRLTKENNLFIAEAPKGTLEAKQVVIATGYRKPFIPSFAKNWTSDVQFSIHSSKYKNPPQMPGKKVLIVGNGNSASQIAIELSKTHRVAVAIHHEPRTLPRTVLGKNMYWWMEVLGIMDIPSDSFIGSFFAYEKDFVVGSDLARAIQREEIRAKPGVKNVQGRAVVFDDGAEEKFDTIIWATGFRPDYSWLKIPGIFNPNGTLNHQRGVSAAPGLYFAGLRNQLTNVSSNIYGAKKVSQFIADALTSTSKIGHPMSNF